MAIEYISNIQICPRGDFLLQNWRSGETNMILKFVHWKWNICSSGHGDRRLRLGCRRMRKRRSRMKSWNVGHAGSRVTGVHSKQIQVNIGPYVLKYLVVMSPVFIQQARIHVGVYMLRTHAFNSNFIQVHICQNIDITHAVRHWLLTAECWVWSQWTSCEIPGGRIDTPVQFSLSMFGFPLLIITSPLFHSSTASYSQSSGIWLHLWLSSWLVSERNCRLAQVVSSRALRFALGIWQLLILLPVLFKFV